MTTKYAGNAFRYLSHAGLVILVLIMVVTVSGGCKGSRASGSTVTGRALRLPGASAVPFVRVLVDGDEASRLQVTDSNGSYTMFGLPVGSYTVTFARFGFQLYTQDLVINEGEETYVVDLAQITPGIEQIGGTITSLDFPVTDAEIWLIFDDGGLVSATTNSNGEYTITGLPSGIYTVVAEGNQLVTEVFEGVYIGFEGTMELNIDLEPVVPFAAANLTGVVTNKDGEILDEAYVGIFPSGTVPSLEMVAVGEALSDLTGYTLTTIPEGTYTVLCTRSGYVLTSELLIVEPGNHYTIDFELGSEESL